MYIVDGDLGDRFEDLKCNQVGNELKLRLTGKANLPLGAFSDKFTLRIKSGSLGDFTFATTVYGRVLETELASQ